MHDPCSASPVSSRIQFLEHPSKSNVEQLLIKEKSEQEAQNKIIELQAALVREQNQARDHINQIEEMAEREKQRILKHLEEEKRFTRDIINKSETMIEQLKRELSSERKRKTDEQKAHDALRDIYKKITPRQSDSLSKHARDESNTKENGNDDDDESHLDGETTVYHRDDPFLASTPRDRSLLAVSNISDDSNAFHRQLEEHLREDHAELLLDNRKSTSNLTTETFYSSLPPTSKRRTNTTVHSNISPSFNKSQPTVIKLDPTSNTTGNLNLKVS